MKPEPARVVVVGGGPAGLSAALNAALSGASVLLIDSSSRLGGQYWRHLPETWLEQSELHLDLDTGLLLISAVANHPKIEIWSGAEIWSATHEDGAATLRLITNGVEKIITTKALVLATGAYDRTLPFPGWDIPGVMTPGGAQSLIKGNGIAVGKRVVVAGSGPSLLPVAAGLAQVGCEVIELLEANSPLRWLKSLPTLIQNLSKIGEAAHYIAIFNRFGVRPKFNRAVVAAHANQDGELESVSIAKIDSNFKIKKIERVKCDVAAIGWGFTADTSLAGALLLKQLVTKDEGVAVLVDENQESSIAGIFAAGEITGIGGSELSIAEGVIAGLAAAKYIGCKAEISNNHHKTRAKKQKFAKALISSYPVKSGWQSWLTDETIICRCEEVKYSKLKFAVTELGATDSRTAKLLSRCGMGMCQGRICGRFVVDLVANESGISPSDISEKERISVGNRPIITPISIELLANGE